MKRIFMIAAMNALFLFCFMSPSLATMQCYGFKEAVSNADLIFQGKAIETGRLTPKARKEYREKYGAGNRRDNILPDTYTEFEVITQYKAPANKTLKVFYRTLPLSEGNGPPPCCRIR